MWHLSQYLLYHRCLYLVPSILSKTFNSLCFWVPLLADEWNYIVLKPQAVPADILVITLIYTDIHLNGNSPRDGLHPPFSLLL